MWIDLPPPDPGIEVTFASYGMSKGLAQTDGAQLVGRGLVQIGAGQIGAQWKNVVAPNAKGEAALFAGITRPVDSVQLSLGAAYKFQTATRGNSDTDALEFNAAGVRKIGPHALRFSLVYSPDDLGSTTSSLFAEAGPSFALGRDWKLTAAFAHRWRGSIADYTAFNAGISRILFKKATLDLRYFTTAQTELGKAYRGRTVLSLRTSF